MAGARRTTRTASRSRSCSSCTSSRAARRRRCPSAAGDFVTLDELIETIGVDATRWFMISRSHESTIDLDLELAAKQDPENPVYYVQYAHARIASILRNARTGWSSGARRDDRARSRSTTSERELIRKLLAFPSEVREATERRAPHRIAELRARARAGLRRVLSRLAGAQGARRDAAGVPDRALRRVADAHSPPRSVCSASRLRRPCRCSTDVVDHGPGAHAAALRPRRQPGLILCNGPHCVSIAASQLRACAETFEIIADEKRATRTPGSAPRGRLHDGGEVVLYAGTTDDLVSVTLEPSGLRRVA